MKTSAYTGERQGLNALQSMSILDLLQILASQSLLTS